MYVVAGPARPPSNNGRDLKRAAQARCPSFRACVGGGATLAWEGHTLRPHSQIKSPHSQADALGAGRRAVKVPAPLA